MGDTRHGRDARGDWRWGKFGDKIRAIFFHSFFALRIFLFLEIINLVRNNLHVFAQVA